ncbi:hypothetical protein [Nonomuraea sp. 10N515B]|uniref:hypothetical protein n=1 Tax=Nonomuraea sp. 10N515B TaxID=3457422 RepID=UPI003FCE7369
MIDVGRDAKVKALIGGSVAGVIGVMTLYWAATGQVTGGADGAPAGVVFGLIFLAIGLLPIAAWRRLSRPRRLVFDGFGVRWDDPRGKPWAVAWGELSDLGFRARHPDMEHLWEFHTVKNGYRLPLGSNPKYIPVIEQAMRQFRPAAYLGVRDEGLIVGLV